MMYSMSFQEYSSFLNTNTISLDKEKKEMVERVGNNIKYSVTEYFRGINKSEVLNGFRWEFNLIEDKQINAWCMPGGKIVVYTGLFDIVKTEEELAVVMGHEIAHAVAKHGSERFTQGLLVQMGYVGLDYALKEKPQETKTLWMSAFGVGTEYGIVLPFSRTHEYEADYLGTIFMAMAGYDPYTSITFWEKMKAKKNGQSIPEFLSTHPSDSNRISNLRKKMSEITKKYYKRKK